MHLPLIYMQILYIIFDIMEGIKCDMLTSTIVLAMYNGKNYIVEQLDSLLNQSHQPDKVIVADDGSDDGSVELVEKYIADHNLNEKWFCKKNKKNLGYADNFWYAAREVDTDIFFFCDQDDIWKESKIETMLKIFEEHHQVMVLGSGYTAFTDEGKKYRDVALTRISETNELKKIELTSKTIFIGCEGCTMAVRTAFFEKIAKYHYDRAPHDEFVWKAALCVNGCYVLHKSLMMRRFHANNVTHNKMHSYEIRLNFLKLLLESHQTMLNQAKDVNLSNNQIKMINNNIVSVKYRIHMIKTASLFDLMILAVKYRKYFHSKKAIIVEYLIAMKNKGK